MERAALGQIVSTSPAAKTWLGVFLEMKFTPCFRYNTIFACELNLKVGIDNSLPALIEKVSVKLFNVRMSFNIGK